MKKLLLAILTAMSVCAASAQTVIEIPFVQYTPLHVVADAVTIELSGDGIVVGSGVSVEGGDGSYSYSWTDAGGTVLATTPTYKMTRAGQYYLVVSDGQGCQVSTLFTATGTTGIDLDDGRWVTGNEELKEVRVFDASGKLLKKFKPTDLLSLTEEAGGAYLIVYVYTDGTARAVKMANRKSNRSLIPRPSSPLLYRGKALRAAMRETSPVVHYAKASLNATLNLHWTSQNYGTIQWQQSKDRGATWADISSATSPAYTFKTGNSGESWFRVVVNGDEACGPYTETHVVKVVNFTVDLIETTAQTALFEVKNLNIPADEIVEYGFCVNYNGLSRTYSNTPRMAVGTTLPEGNPFEVRCEGLLPAKSYSVRVYFKTADGSIVYGPGKLTKTTPGIEWDTEDWSVKSNFVSPRFKVSGYSGAAPQMKFEFGTAGNMREYATRAVNGKNMVFTTSSTITGLHPGTEYIARLWADLDGDEQVIEKTVRTMPDYSTFEVDNTVVPAKHRIVWSNNKNPIQLNPDNIQAEYPRLLRLSADTLLLTYHGGDGSGRGVDHWKNIYLSRSTDNGASWSAPEKIMDPTKTWTHNWFRFCNPELVKLQNGWVLMTFSGNGNPETNDNCEVLVMISKDGGQTWGDPITVMRGRTWEPMIVQLPGGDLELLVSSEAQWWQTSSQGPQEIRSARSTDNGQTWTTSTRASYNPGMRDGMPVAVVLQGNKGVLFSIECPGSASTPSLLYRPLTGSWETGDWDRIEDDRRWHNENIQGGCAPHMIQLTTGEIVMCAHNNQNGSVWQTSRSQVSVGDNTGHNFGSRTIPFNWLPNGQGAYYACLFQKDEETIWLVISHCTYDGTTCTRNAVEYIEGKIVAK